MINNNSCHAESRQTRSLVYGFSVFTIMLCHWGVFPIGYFGVDIFTFLSGYYLTNKYYESKLKLTSFYMRRFVRLYPAYWTILVPFLFLYVRQNGLRNYVYILLNILGFSNRFMFRETNLVPGSWFLAMIVSLYLLYPIVIRLFKNSQNRFLPFLLLSSSTLLAQYVLLQKSMLPIMLRIPLFFLGVYISILEQEQNGFIKRMRNDRLVLPLFSLSYLILFQISSMHIPYEIRWSTGILWWSSVVFVPICIFPLFTLMDVLNSKILCPLKIMGNCSLEVYLLHEPMMHIISPFVDGVWRFPHKWSISIVICVFFTTFFAYILRATLDKMFRRRALQKPSAADIILKNERKGSIPPA